MKYHNITNYFIHVGPEDYSGLNTSLQLNLLTYKFITKWSIFYFVLL